MNPVETSASSAEKILWAATDLFAANHFNGVSIKEIAKKSGVNSALISYYFGGKKNLYQEVLNEQSNLFLNLIARVSCKELSPLAKLREYIAAISEVQKLHPHRIHLIYRELLTPTFMCDSFIKNRLYKIHKFMSDLVTDGIADGSIKKNVLPTHVAFTLESIIVFFFLTHNQIRDLGNFEGGKENTYLEETLNTYLSSITNQVRGNEDVD